MYYPIIDKLKEVMQEIGQSGGGDQLVIGATATSDTGGTWVGNFSDIEAAFANNTPVYCAISTEGQTFLFTLVSYLVPGFAARCTPISVDSNRFINIIIRSNNTFTLTTE